MPTDPPEGFDPHFRKSPVTNPWEPLFSRRIDGTVQIGLWLREVHCNSRGLLHGGVIAALADNAMGLSCGSSLPSVQGLVTVSLTVDYVGAAKIGQWLQIEPRVLRTGKSMGFADALVTADGTISRACQRHVSRVELTDGHQPALISIRLRPEPPALDVRGSKALARHGSRSWFDKLTMRLRLRLTVNCSAQRCFHFRRFLRRRQRAGGLELRRE